MSSTVLNRALPKLVDLCEHCLEIGLCDGFGSFGARCQATAWITDLRCRSTYQAEGMVTVMIQPEEHHNREQMTKVEGWRCWVDASVEAYFPRAEELIESIAVTGAQSARP